MGQDIMRLLAKWLINSLALFAAAYIVPGVTIHDFWSGLAAAALLGIVNAIIRPVVLVFTLPLNLLTLGLFTFVINAMMLSLVAWLIGGFSVTGFWPALFGAIVVSVVSWLVSLMFDGGKGRGTVRFGGGR